jgi:NhaP-type Na+/H+ or K+/H+ antiporter
VQVTISLLTPFAAYIPAERLQVSGVLAVVSAKSLPASAAGAAASFLAVPREA